MSQGAFQWNKWKSNQLPTLEDHSRTKLAVLGDYIDDYITIRCKKDSHRRERFPLLLVDGFAGGGVYAGGERGSPLVMLEAVRAAEAKINVASRTKQLQIDVHYFFVETNQSAYQCLEAELNRSEFKHLLGKQIHLHHSTFRQTSDSIIAFADRFFPRHGVNAIFLLDQCGYTDVDATLIRDISARLHHRAEFIINFAIDWLVTFITDSAPFRKIVPQMGLGDRITADDLIRARAEAGDSWQFAVESQIGAAFQATVGSKVFSPFFIESSASRRGYWLLHLAPHHRARSAMVDVQWRHANGFRHYSHVGLHMLQYRSDRDLGSYLHGMDLGQATQDQALAYLTTDFARQVRDHHSAGLTVDELHTFYANHTIANNALIDRALVQARNHGEIRILGPNGASKRNGSLSGKDIILPDGQFKFFSAR